MNEAERIFQEALDRPSGERAAFARERCAGNEDLLEQVLRMLQNDPGTEVDGPVPMRLGPQGKRLTDPDRIGPYRILERLGEGGFGVVYEVEQTEPIRRRLALKLLKAGMDTEDVLARFDAERQALALMDHPCIARVHDAGATEHGRPYFAMELVRGDPVNTYCDRENLDLDARLKLFEDICRAVQHAHQRGVIHRDLKPSNLLVTRVDGEATPKVIDFGIAKALTTPLVNRTLHTVAGQMMGTPTYMSPEQAERSGIDVDTSADVYSLGVVLYEMLCGQLPVNPEEFHAVTPQSYAELVRKATRRRPSQSFHDINPDAIERAKRRGGDPWQLRSKLRGDLDSIVMRAIARDRSRRYQTVQELIDELQRYRHDEPVLAGPPGVRYRVSKFVRRHRVGLGVAAALCVGVIGGGAALTWSWLEARHERAEAESARAESEAVTEFLIQMLGSARPTMAGRDVTVVEAMDIAAGELSGSFEEQPEVEARLHNVIGGTYRELAQFESARDHLIRGHDISRLHLGAEHPRTLEIQREIGQLHRHAGEYAAAESTFTQVLRVRERVLPANDRAIVQSLEDLGAMYMTMEDGERSLPVLERAYDMAIEHLGREDILLSRIANDLGSLHTNLGNLAASESLLLISIDLDREFRSSNRIERVQTMQNLAATYRESGRFEESESFYREAYDLTAEVFGKDHPATARIQSNYALLLSDMGRYDESLVHSQAVVAWREKELGPENPSTLVSCINLALLYYRMEDFEAALATARETSARCRRVVDEDHLYTIAVDGTIGRSLQALGRLEEADRLLANVIVRAERSMGAEHWRVGRAKLSHGSCLIDRGQYARAEELILDSYRILTEQLGPDHKRSRDAAEELVRLYGVMGDEEKAAEWSGKLAEAG